MTLLADIVQPDPAAPDSSLNTLPEFASAELLDIAVHAMTVRDLTRAVKAGIDGRHKWIIANHNLHSLYLYHKHPLFKTFFQKTRFTHIDGMSLVALARFYGYEFYREHRTGYTDWLPVLMPVAAEEQWKVFYLGSAPDVVHIGAEQLRKSYPGLMLNARHGFFDLRPCSLENQLVLDEIRRFEPHILMVGMGMPRQELWIAENLDAIQANVILACGAALDYVAGAIPTPPRWLGKLGLEWAFRLASEPRRLASRYLIEPWSIVGLVLADVLGRRSTVRAWSQDGTEECGRSCDART